jgi:hypothetical protein
METIGILTIHKTFTGFDSVTYMVLQANDSVANADDVCDFFNDQDGDPNVEFTIGMFGESQNMNKSEFLDEIRNFDIGMIIITDGINTTCRTVDTSELRSETEEQMNESTSFISNKDIDLVYEYADDDGDTIVSSRNFKSNFEMDEFINENKENPSFSVMMYKYNNYGSDRLHVGSLISENIAK